MERKRSREEEEEEAEKEEEKQKKIVNDLYPLVSPDKPPIVEDKLSEIYQSEADKESAMEIETNGENEKREKEKNNNNNNKLPKSYFFVDVETSGQKGMPIWNPKARVIQLSAYHPHTDTWYNRLVKYDDNFFVPAGSVAIHRISSLDLINGGFSPVEVMRGFLDFLEEKSEGGDQILVAHNASFDRNMIRKMINQYLKLSYGRGAGDWKAVFFDTLVAFRTIHPELELYSKPSGQPYSLSSLARTFFGKAAMSGTFHNAETDVKTLYRLFMEKLLPKCPILQTSDWRNCKFFIKPRDSRRLILVSQLQGFGIHRTILLCDEILNPAFANEVFSCPHDSIERKFYESCITTHGLLTTAHIFVYGYMRYRQVLRIKRVQMVPLQNEDRNTWYEICRHVEVMLRSPPLNIACDSTIANVLSCISMHDIVDLAFHTMKEDGSKSFFPTMRGEPISYGKWKDYILPDEGIFLTREFGWGTIHEMLQDYLNRGAQGQEQLQSELNYSLHRKIFHVTETLLETQKYCQ